MSVDLAAYRAAYSNADPAERLRLFYGLGDHVRRGCRIRYMGKPGVITSVCTGGGMYIGIRLDGGAVVHVHPTWRMEYQRPDGTWEVPE